MQNMSQRRLLTGAGSGIAIVALVAKWDDALYEKHLAKAFTDKHEVRGFYDGLRARHGTCAVESATHGAFERLIRLGCGRGGDLNLKLTLERWPVIGFHATREHGQRL